MERHLQAPISKEELKLWNQEIMYILQELFIQRGMLRIKNVWNTAESGKSSIDIQDQIIYYMGPSPARKDVLSVL